MVKVLDAPFMFGDNFSVVNLTIMSSGKLQRRSHILNYHLTREAQADVIIKFVHMNGKEIPAGIVTKRCTPNTWFPITKPLLFLRDMDYLKEQFVAEGIENRSSTPPLSQAKGTPQK